MGNPETDTYKDKIYIIGSISQADRIKSTADYYIKTGRYRVRYVKEEPEKIIENTHKGLFPEYHLGGQGVCHPQTGRGTGRRCYV